MEKLIRIAVFLAVIYFAYQYWKSNISEKGIAKKKMDEGAQYRAIADLAAKLQTDRHTSDQLECNARYQAGVYEWTDVDRCKAEKIRQEILVDWGALAKAQLGF